MDPLTNTHVKLLAFDFQSLTQRSSNHTLALFRNGRPVSKAETLGVVVSREHKSKFLKFLVDDGTGLIPCIIWLNHLDSPYFFGYHPSDVRLLAQIAADQVSKIQLGTLARVQGKITAYRGTLQITVTSVSIEKDANAEILHWLDCIRLARDCYNVAPPTISRIRGL